MNSSFDIELEVSDRDEWTVHNNIGKSVDLLLQEKDSTGQVRTRTQINNLKIKTQREYDLSAVTPQKNWRNTQTLNPLVNNNSKESWKRSLKKGFKASIYSEKPFKIYCYCLSSKLFETLNLGKYLNYSLTTKLNSIIS